MLSVSLSGFINYLDEANPSKPKRILKGHNKPITAVTLSEDHSIIYTASHDGAVTNWNSGNGSNDRIGGAGHGNQVNGVKSFSDFAYTCGIDDSLKQISIESNAYTGVDLKLSCQPRGMDYLKEENIIIVGCVKEIVVVKDNMKASSIPIQYEASSVSINRETREVAVGGDDMKVHIYTLAGTSLELKTELEHLGAVTDVVYSPDCKSLVACDSNRKVIMYTVAEYKLAHTKEWGFHNAKINKVAWSPNSMLVASGSLDTNIIVWSVANPSKHTIIKSKFIDLVKFFFLSFFFSS